jgi:hypothetical protein
MNFNMLLSSLVLLLVGAFFIINTSSSDSKAKNQDGVMKDGMYFQSGIVNNGKKKIEYVIFTSDYGVHWWAVKQSETKWHIAGTADEVYPGLITLLSDPVHAELALREYQEKPTRRY